MKNCYKKSLAFLLAFTMIFSEFLPVSAAEFSEPVVTADGAEEQMTQDEQNVGTISQDEQQDPEEVIPGQEATEATEATEEKGGGVMNRRLRKR